MRSTKFTLGSYESFGQSSGLVNWGILDCDPCYWQVMRLKGTKKFNVSRYQSETTGNPVQPHSSHRLSRTRKRVCHICRSKSGIASPTRPLLQSPAFASSWTVRWSGGVCHFRPFPSTFGTGTHCIAHNAVAHFAWRIFVSRNPHRYEISSLHGNGILCR